MWDTRGNLKLRNEVYLTEQETFVLFCLSARKHLYFILVNSTACQLGQKIYRLQLLLYERCDEHSAVSHPKGVCVCVCVCVCVESG